MARKPTALPPEVVAQIEARTARGESAAIIFQAIGGVISTATIERMQRRLRRPAPLGAAPSVRDPVAPRAIVAAPLARASESPDVPDEVPPTATTEDIDRWIARLKKGADVAEEQGNLAALASISAKAAQLMALRHRATPLP